MRLVKFIVIVVLIAAVVFFAALGFSKTRFGVWCAERYVEDVAGATVSVGELDLNLLSLKMENVSLSLRPAGGEISVKSVERSPWGVVATGVSGRVSFEALTGRTDGIRDFSAGLSDGASVPEVRLLRNAGADGSLKVLGSALTVVFTDGELILDEFEFTRDPIRVPGHGKAYRNVLSFACGGTGEAAEPFSYSAEWFDVSEKTFVYSSGLAAGGGKSEKAGFGAEDRVKEDSVPESVVSERADAGAAAADADSEAAADADRAGGREPEAPGTKESEAK